MLGNASAQDHAAKATVPFGFHVGDTWLPAGTYTVSSDSRSPNVILIRSGDNKIAVFSLANQDSQRATSDKLVFRKCGYQYFLHQVLCPNSRMNVQFPGSKREREARTREANLAGATDVTLALK